MTVLLSPEAGLRVMSLRLQAAGPLAVEPIQLLLVSVMLPDLRLLSAFLLVPVPAWPPLSARLVPSVLALSGQTWQILLPVVPSAAGLLDAAELPRVSAGLSAAGLLDAAELLQVSAVLPQSAAEP